MKVAFAENNVKGSQGLQETGAFQIRAGAHAFKLLSSGLYSDKVRAVLREIGCNAADAHIAAGDPLKPFVVKVPNSLDDQFYVQDWGPGMSHDEVMGLYTTYFASTKQDSNDYTGAFGLGSKSPFSYTDSFTVVSTHGGAKRTYALYIDNKGSPTVSLMAEEPADEGWAHGVRVGFAVKPADYRAFQDKAQEVYQWFRVAPEMRGMSAVRPVQFKFDCDDYSLTEGRPPTVLMGNVAYPLDLEQLGIGPEDDKLKSDLLYYVPSLDGLALRLEIGSVQVAASREALQYDPESVKTLQEKLRLAVRRAGKVIIAELEAMEMGGWKELCQAREKINVLSKGRIHYSFEHFAPLFGMDEARAKKLHTFVNQSYYPIPACAGARTAAKLVRDGRHAKAVVHAVADGVTSFGRKATLAVHPRTVIVASTVKYAAMRAKLAVSNGAYEQIVLLTRGKDREPSPVELAAEAMEVSNALMRMEVFGTEVLPELPPGMVAPKKKSRGKKWVPALPTGVTFSVIRASGPVQDELGNCHKAFMCDYNKSSWHNRRSYVRLAKAPIDQDTVFDRHHWDKMWERYLSVARLLDLKDTVTEYAMLSIAEVKSSCVKLLGWPTAYDAMVEYMGRQDVADHLLKKVKTWHPTPPSYFHNGGWISGMSYRWQTNGIPGSLVKLLDRAKVAKVLAKMWAEPKRSTASRQGIPKELEAYRELMAMLRLADKTQGVGKAEITIEDLDASFARRFPILTAVGVNDFLELFDQRPPDAAALLELAISREVP